MIRRRNILLVLSLWPLTCPAYAEPCAGSIESRVSPCTPSQQEKDDIVAAVKKARAARIEVLEEAAGARSMMQGAESYPHSLDMLEGWAATRRSAEAKAHAANDEAQAVIQLTIKTYGLSGLYSHGEIASGPHISSGVTPTPFVIENGSRYFASTGTDGKTHYAGFPKDLTGGVGGYTLPDGQIFIVSRVLDIVEAHDDPRILAVSLHHEGVHFRNLSSGLGWSTKEEEEASAYDADISMSDVFQLRPEEKRILYAHRAVNQRVKPGDRHALHGDSAEAAAKQGFLDQEGLLDNIRRREADLTENLRLARLRRDQEAAARIPSPDLIQDISARASWARASADLNSLADRACREGLWGADRNPDFVSDWFRWRETYYDQIQLDSTLSLWADLSSFPGSVNCVTFIVNQIVVARRDRVAKINITPTWVTEVVKEAFVRSNPVRPSPPIESGQPPEMTIPANPLPGDDDRRPAPPAIPHCRYHPWCKG